jgi:molybdate transport system substrate-binding protein
MLRNPTFTLPFQVMLIASFLSVAAENPLRAAEITFLCAAALHPAMDEIIPEFQKATGHSVKPSFANIGVNTDRVRKGDAADLVIVSPQQWEDLKNEGKIDANTRPVVAKIGIGVFVRKGAARPDIGSVEAFKRTFLNARSIAVPLGVGNPVGVYAVGLFDRLGIAADLRPPKNVNAGGGSPLQAVARGPEVMPKSDLPKSAK